MRILSVCEKIPRKQDTSLMTAVSSKHGIFLECAFMLLPGIADRTKLGSNYSLLLAGVIPIDI